MWQDLHAELEPKGLTVVTVALDTNPEAARRVSSAANPTHPSLVDPSLSLVAAFGITNVPFGIWIDEEGVIVRPAEVAFAPRRSHGAAPENTIPAGLPPERLKVIEGMTRAIGNTDRYALAVRDWVEKGSNSPYVLSRDDVRAARSRPYG
jgi:hypothetical protein